MASVVISALCLLSIWSRLWEGALLCQLTTQELCSSHREANLIDTTLHIKGGTWTYVLRWHVVLWLPGIGTEKVQTLPYVYHSAPTLHKVPLFFFSFLGKLYQILPYSLGMFWNQQNGKWALNWEHTAPFTCNLLQRNLDLKHAKLVYYCSLTKFPMGKGTMELSAIFHWLCGLCRKAEIMHLLVEAITIA